MKKLLIFDSDFIYANKKVLKDILTQFNEYDCYIPEISVNEISYLVFFEKLEIINKFKDNVSRYSSLGISFAKSDEEIKNIIIDKTTSNTKKLFNDNIILHHSRNLETIVDRAYNKQAPFGKSDKGFKDTLILLDIIDFIKGKKVKQSYFITNDKDFLDNKQCIIDEVSKKTDNNFEILEGKDIDKLINYFNLDITKKESKKKNTINNSKIDAKKIRQDLRNVLFNIKHFVYADEYFPNEKNVGNNYEILSSLSIDDITKFIDNLEYNLNINIFNTNVHISDFFDNPFLFSKENYINVEYFEKLNELYSEIKNNNELKIAFINAIYKELKDMPGEEEQNENDEIPYL